jgi:predicted nucleic acid-binding protein
LTTTDTLVAATAIKHGATLITANVKDYPMEEIELLQQP